MARDPAFLFYDSDAARDVSHMNRLERGCYFDLIQAQRKFGGYTTEQARKILGKDFDLCWDALTLILSCENNIYFIEWVRDSMEKRKEHAEKQRVRIQNYWDEKKKEVIPVLNHGNTTVLPLVNESENVIVIDTVINYNGVVENFHLYCDRMAKVSKLSDQRKKHIAARYKEFDYKTMIEVIKKAGKSDFLCGVNDKCWKADFDWIFNPTNFLKIMEGKYENKINNASIVPKFNSGPGR